MDLMDNLWAKAIQDKKTIVLPEGEEERNLIAASKILSEGIANIVLIGNEDRIISRAQELNIDVNLAKIVDHNNSDKKSYYAKELYELRKHKGVTLEEALKLLDNPIYFATMMVKLGEADGMVSGAIHTTGDLLRPALQIIKTAPNVSLVSSFFIMVTDTLEYGDNGTILFADCAMNENPNAEQLAMIAVETAKTAKQLCSINPRVALLSFSTKGSAEHESINKVREALSISKTMDSSLAIDGELQLDAAIVPKVALQKAPNSDVAGYANVLIFPNLEAGNIGYKLVERLAKAKAIGPICQGFAKPVNDLSRGCSADDIVNVVAVTAVQAQFTNQ